MVGNGGSCSKVSVETATLFKGKTGEQPARVLCVHKSKQIKKIDEQKAEVR